jgi:outer membrane protein assembly factor BamB
VLGVVIVVAAGHLLWMEWAIAMGRRFADAPGGITVGALVVAAIYGLALAVLARWRKGRSPGVGGWLTLFLGAALTARYYSPRYLAPRAITAAHVSPSLVTYLRELTAAQEQFRLRRGTYAESIDSLRAWVQSPRGSRTTLVASADRGWSAEATLDGIKCSMWVRDSTLESRSTAEGVVSCDKREQYLPHQVSTWRPDRECAAPQPRAALLRIARSPWLQHRGNARRSGVTRGDSVPRHWTARVCGDLRTGVAAADNQVFVGAHGTGELAALSIIDGMEHFRLRTPNWIHHDPVVIGDLVIVSFGNSEMVDPDGRIVGSPPSGLVTYDRATGFERWRRYTHGSVMTTPVVFDSIVAAVTGGSEAVAWHIRNGAELWRSRLSGVSPMGNPLLLDTLMLVGVEAAGICALDVRTGKRLYCRRVARRGHGAGHASVSGDGNMVVMLYDKHLSFRTLLGALRDGHWSLFAAHLFGAPIVGGAGEKADAPVGEHALVALRASDGQELWRAPLGVGRLKLVGHYIGAPVLADSSVYAISPIRGNVTAADARSGQVRWSVDIGAVRGSPLVVQGVVIAATRAPSYMVLDAVTGQRLCEQVLPGPTERAGPVISGVTGILTLRSGLVIARPISEWIACRA